MPRAHRNEPRLEADRLVIILYQIGVCAMTCRILDVIFIYCNDMPFSIVEYVAIVIECIGKPLLALYVISTRHYNNNNLIHNIYIDT